MSLTRYLTCKNCGAPVPISGDERLRCFFCFHEVDIKPEIRAAQRDFEVLNHRIQNELEATVGSFDSEWSLGDRLATWIGVMWIASPVVFVFVMAFRAKSAIQLVNVLGPLGFVSAFLGILLSGLLKPRFVRKYKEWAFAAIHVDESVEARCPACGANLSYDDVTAVCSYCGTQSILPALLVPVSKRRKYTRILAAKTRAEEIEQSYDRRVNRRARVGGILLSIYTVFWYFLMLILPPAEDLTVEGNIAVVPVLGVFFGLVMFFAAKQSDREMKTVAEARARRKALQGKPERGSRR